MVFLDIPTTQMDLESVPDEMAKMVLSCSNDMLISFYDLIARTELKKKRQSEGIKAMKDKRGWHRYGRPRVVEKEEFKAQYKRVINKEIGSPALMRQLGLNKDTYFRYVREYKQNNLTLGDQERSK